MAFHFFLLLAPSWYLCHTQELDKVIVSTCGDPLMAVRQEMVTERHWKSSPFQFVGFESTEGFFEIFL